MIEGRIVVQLSRESRFGFVNAGILKVDIIILIFKVGLRVGLRSCSMILRNEGYDQGLAHVASSCRCFFFVCDMWAEWVLFWAATFKGDCHTALRSGGGVRPEHGYCLGSLGEGKICPPR